MTKNLLIAASLLFLGLPATVRAEEGGSVAPSVSVAPIPGGGVVVTPSVTTSVPLGGGASLQGNVQVPIVVPQSGPAFVPAPSFSFGARIPF